MGRMLRNGRQLGLVGGTVELGGVVRMCDSGVHYLRTCLGKSAVFSLLALFETCGCLVPLSRDESSEQ